jgi:hypothetical protein
METLMFMQLQPGAGNNSSLRLAQHIQHSEFWGNAPTHWQSARSDSTRHVGGRDRHHRGPRLWVRAFQEP